MKNIDQKYVHTTCINIYHISYSLYFHIFYNSHIFYFSYFFIFACCLNIQRHNSVIIASNYQLRLSSRLRSLTSSLASSASSMESSARRRALRPTYSIIIEEKCIMSPCLLKITQFIFFRFGLSIYYKFSRKLKKDGFLTRHITERRSVQKCIAVVSLYGDEYDALLNVALLKPNRKKVFSQISLRFLLWLVTQKEKKSKSTKKIYF